MHQMQPTYVQQPCRLSAAALNTRSTRLDAAGVGDAMLQQQCSHSADMLQQEPPYDTATNRSCLLYWLRRLPKALLTRL